MLKRTSRIITLVSIAFMTVQSAQAKFLSVDPVQFDPNNPNPAMFNRYAYAINDPINIKDPDGRCSVGADGSSVGLCPTDLGAAAVMVKQYFSANSLQSQVNSAATAKGLSVLVTTKSDSPGSRVVPLGPGGNRFNGTGTSAVVQLDTSPSTIQVTTQSLGEILSDGLSTATLTVPTTEKYEHELSHALSTVNGNMATGGVGSIRASGQMVTGTLGQEEANAVNQTNEYRKNQGVDYRRATYD